MPFLTQPPHLSEFGTGTMRDWGSWGNLELGIDFMKNTRCFCKMSKRKKKKKVVVWHETAWLETPRWNILQLVKLLKNRHDSVMNITVWTQKYFTVWEHSSLFCPQALFCKEEAICDHDPEIPPPSLRWSIFKIDWGKVESSDKSKIAFFETVDVVSGG